jgi:carbamoyl-phosphate synthase large subunit
VPPRSYRCILITGASGDVADAVARIVAEEFPAARLVGADAGDPWPGLAVFPRVDRLPPAASPDYGAALADLAVGCGADLVIPTNEHEIRRLASDPGPAASLPLLINPPDALLPFLDKLETARWLAAVGVPAPATRPLAEATAADLPFVAKPARSSGSRAVTVVRTPEQLAAARQVHGPDAVAQELLEPADAEFTCALARPAGRPLWLAMRRRLLGGLSSEIRIERHEAIDDLLRAIDAALPGYAALNVQLRLTAGGPRVFEINPRISSTAMMRHRAGFRDVAWILRARLGLPVPARYEPPVGLRVFRRFEEKVAPP